MRLDRISVGCVVSSLVTSAASAALVPTLTNITSGSTGQTYSYNVVLTGDEGVSTSAPNPAAGTSVGTQFVIFDFAGYVADSIFSSNPLFTATAELSTPGLPVLPGASDNPALYNLHFTYNGPPVQTSGGPFPNMSEGTFGAVSTFSGMALSDFSSIAVKNTGMPEAVGTAAYNQGSVLVASSVGSVPEAATWAMMVGGFGLLGTSLRRRRTLPLFG